MMMAAYGEIVSVLSRSPQHRDRSLADLEWLAAPAVMTGQFSLAEAQMKGRGLIAPIGLAMWAHVSADVDRRLTENIANAVRLKPEEWKSGDILWLVDAVGDGRVIEAMLKRLVATEWKGREARMRARTKDGTFKVGVITAASGAPIAAGAA
jgi:cytolysin-activating lysine-acyltransferase